jgi:predicted Na+-dependent transporter
MTDFELENMRQQMTTLKKKLEHQEIVNDRMIRQLLRRNTSKINRSYMIVSVLCLLMIPYSYWAFVKLNGSSIGVWIATSVLMLLAFGYTVYTGRHLRNDNLYERNLLDARKKVAQAKKLDSDWLKIGIPAVLLWLGYFLYDNYQHMSGDDFELYAVGMTIAVIIGGFAGLRIHMRNQSNYQDIIDQIEDMSEYEE